MFQTPTAIPVKRGCGTRKLGGCYAELGLSEHGSPVWDFLVDPPMAVPTEINISPQGVTLFEHNGKLRILDWVGEQYYPNPTDDIMEIRSFGMSARLELPTADDYKRLNQDTRILRAHRRAGISNWQDINALRLNMQHPAFNGQYEWEYCPQDREAHVDGWCAGLLWQNVCQMGPHPDPDYQGKGLPYGYRIMPSFGYYGAYHEQVSPIYYTAIYASFPIGRLVVINDPEEGAHEQKLDKLAGCGLPVDLVEE